MDELGEHGALLVEHPDGTETSTAERASHLDDKTQQNLEFDLFAEMKRCVEGSRQRGWVVEIQG
jgi:hypothetical protein